ncbi:MAG TPA: anion permease [Kineosporiaceae bacterium]|nr:anion permease [Kineosporiaceae bacterium]
MRAVPHLHLPHRPRSAPDTERVPADSVAAPGGTATGSAGSTAGAGTPSAPGDLVPANLIRLLVPIVVGLAIWFVPAPHGLKPAAIHLLAIFVATIVGIIVKPLPMGAVALIGIMATALTNTLTPDKALSGFSNGTIWLIVIAFFIARGFIKTGLGQRIAYFFVSRLGRRTLGLSYGLVATDLVMAPAIPSNTARAGGVIYPILRSLSSTYGSEPNSPSSRKVGSFLTAVSFHANAVTSAMFITAMAANPLAVALAKSQHVDISWGRWALAALVPGLVSLAVIPLLLYKIYPPELKATPQAADEARQRLAEMGPMTAAEKVMLGAFGALLLLWTLGDQWLGINSTVAALVGLAILLVAGVLTWDDIKQEQGAWDTLIWFAALVMMATQLNALGLIPWASKQMSSLVHGWGWVAAFIVLSVAYFYAHYFFASNTAHVSAMYAAFLGTAVVAGAPPLLAALVLGFVSSLFGSLTHYACGPAPVLFGGGYVGLGAWWRLGAVVSVANIVIWMAVGGAWMKLLGIW